MQYEEKNEAGRVVDLKKMVAAEKDQVQLESTEQKPQKNNKGGFFVFRLSSSKKPKKAHRVDFLHHYKNLEKKEDFIEREIFKEYLNDEEEEKKQNILTSFFHFFTGVLKLWWLPLFIIRFVWILFWRIGKLLFLRKKAGQEKIHKGKSAIVKAEAAKSAPMKTAAAKKQKKEKRRSFWSMPMRIKDFLLGRPTDDYFYRCVLLEEISRRKFRPLRHVFSFIFLLLLIILPIGALNYYNIISINDLRGRVLGASERAIGNLRSAATSASGLDLKGAEENFAAATENFTKANDSLSEISGILFELGKAFPNDKIRLAAESREILAAGAAASSLGKNLSLAAGCFLANGGETISEMINNFVGYEQYALEDARSMNQEIARINTSVLPAEYREQFLSLKQKGADLEEILSKNIELIKKINIFLGAESDKRYLFTFQNNSEMRASGGFIGSYALIDFSQGKIKNIEAPGGGSYDTEGGMKSSVIAPEPMYLVNPLWHFWDANWWPDWEKSAKKLSWFYEKSGGPTTDGVIAFTPTVLERVLEAIGPIDMNDEQGTVITSENLWENLRQIIEKEKTADSQLSYDLAENKPKKVIGELMQKIMEELPKRIDKDKLAKLLSGLEADLKEKQILLYFKDDGLQAEAKDRNWAGKMKETNKDYLAVINTNIAGGKSDRKMEETINHQAEVQPDGTIIDTVVITRVHTGIKDEPFCGMRNVNWMRIYVPLGSELLQADGFRGPDPIYFSLPEAGWQIDADVAAEEGDNAVIDREHLNTKIYNEGGKTVFANWSMVDPENAAVITLKYKLPFKLEKKVIAEAPKTRLEELMDRMVKAEEKDRFVYSLMVQKQAGSLFTHINTRLVLLENFKIAWKYPAELAAEDYSWQASGKLDSDKYWAVIIEKNIGDSLRLNE